MTDTTAAGIKFGQVLAVGGGGLIAGALMSGPWHHRVFAAICGCLAAVVLGPLLTPVAVHFWTMLLTSLGVPPSDISHDSVANGCGFLIGLTGVDVCRWLIDRTKGTLRVIRLPWMKGGAE